MITGNIFRYNGAPVAWEFKLQKSVALSTAEAEKCLASLGVVEVIYLRQLLRDMDFGPTSPTRVYEDNTACIEWTLWTNNVIGERERAKHVDILALCARSCTDRTSSSQESALMISSPMCSPRASSRHNSLQSLLIFSGVAVIVRDVGLHEGKRDSR